MKRCGYSDWSVPIEIAVALIVSDLSYRIQRNLVLFIADLERNWSAATLIDLHAGQMEFFVSIGGEILEDNAA